MLRRLVVGALLVGCGGAVTSSQVRGPDGQTNWIAITCRHARLCVERAGDACPGGYEVSSHVGSEMLVRCHGPASAEAADPHRFRECIADASCNTGDRCTFDAGGSTLGRCRAP